MQTGGKKEKLKKYPRIIDYLEVKYPAIYELIDDLSMSGSLTPRRGGAITFLNPDAAYVKEIKKVAESDHPEDAVDMISSLILTDLFEKPEDFVRKKESVATLYGTKLLIKSIAQTKVIIEDGEITPDKNFTPFARHGTSKRDNMAVWHLKGKVKYEGVQKVMQPRRTYEHEEKESAVHGSHEEDEKQLGAIKTAVLKDKLSAILYEKKAQDGNALCPFINAVTRLLRVFRDDIEFSEEYRRAKCIITMCPMIDYYLLYCDPLIFPYANVLKAYKRGVDINANAETYRTFCSDYSNEALKSNPDVLLFSAAGVQTANDARVNIHNTMFTKISRETPNLILKEYTECDTKNTINGKGPLYPPSLSNIFATNPGLHLMLDEFAFIVYMGLQDVKSAPDAKEKCKRMQDLMHAIYEAYGSLTNPAKKTRLDQPSSYGMDIDAPNSLYQCVANFWKTWGLHMPCNMQTNFEEFVHGGSEDARNPYSKELVSVDKHFMDELASYDNSEARLSESTMAELRAYVKAHGKLPAEF
jgi:hypothetical protein